MAARLQQVRALLESLEADASEADRRRRALYSSVIRTLDLRSATDPERLDRRISEARTSNAIPGRGVPSREWARRGQAKFGMDHSDDPMDRITAVAVAMAGARASPDACRYADQGLLRHPSLGASHQRTPCAGAGVTEPARVHPVTYVAAQQTPVRGRGVASLGADASRIAPHTASTTAAEQPPVRLAWPDSDRGAGVSNADDGRQSFGQQARAAPPSPAAQADADCRASLSASEPPDDGSEAGQCDSGSSVGIGSHGGLCGAPHLGRAMDTPRGETPSQALDPGMVGHERQQQLPLSLADRTE